MLQTLNRKFIADESCAKVSVQTVNEYVYSKAFRARGCEEIGAVAGWRSR